MSVWPRIGAAAAGAAIVPATASVMTTRQSKTPLHGSGGVRGPPSFPAGRHGMTWQSARVRGPRANEGKRMKRLLVLVATAGLAVGLYAATAGGGQQAVTPGQFAALKKTVTKLQKDVKALNSVIGDCLFVQAVPVASFGT